MTTTPQRQQRKCMTTSLQRQLATVFNQPSKFSIKYYYCHGNPTIKYNTELDSKNVT